MSSHFQSLLTSALADPDASIETLPMLTDRERQQMLVDWNRTGREVPFGKMVDFFEQQRRLRPQAPAVICQQAVWSYEQLDERANQLAHELNRLAVQAEDRVALCLPASVELCQAILAVMKAGAAFVPLESQDPPRRLQGLLEDLQPHSVITFSDCLTDVRLPLHTHRLDLDRPALSLAQQPTHSPPRELSDDQLAYIMYTSGSTGTPKGVEVSHAAVANYSSEMVRQLELDADDRVLQFAPVSFDVLIEELFPTWAAGAAVVIDDREQLIDCRYLQEVVQLRQVTTVELPAGYWREWVNLLEQQRITPPSCLRRVLVGCDKPSSRHLQQWASYGVPLVYVFGLTETTITSSLYKLFWSGSREAIPHDVPIGKPIANTTMYVLDGRGSPVPIGVAGELYIGGVGLARGYFGQQTLTDERFVELELDDRRERLYRTGDQARFREDGNIEFLGRLDEQAKIRGYRVEPAEVAAALRLQADVADAAVIVDHDAEGQARLIAYLQMAAGKSCDVPGLRRRLLQELPAHMAAAVFVPLERIPYTPQGKLDRSQLPEAGQTVSTIAKFAPPTTPLEQTIAEVWSQLLHVDRVSRNDNFFELGGHSLLATQMVLRLERLSGVPLSVRQVFAFPSVAELAEELAKQQSPGAISPTLSKVSRDHPVPLSNAQQRLWFLQQLEPNSAAYNVAAGFRICGSLQVDLLAQAVRQVTLRHEVLRSTIKHYDGVVCQQPDCEEFSWLCEDLTELRPQRRDARVRQVRREERETPFRLDVGPLLRARLLKTGHQEHLLLLTMHHIVCDAWSLGILLRELSSIYNDLVAGLPPDLTPLRIQYADYAAWQRDLIASDALRPDLDYWKQQLAGAQPLELRHDEGAKGTGGGLVVFDLDAATTEHLNQLCREEGVTTYMALLAVFKILLLHHTGETDIVIGTPIATRPRSETEPLIGFFVNSLVLRTDLSGKPTFRESLRRTRDVVLAAFAHQNVPFDMLVESLHPIRDGARNPLFRIMFEHDIANPKDLVLSDLDVIPMSTKAGTAQLPLTLSMVEQEGRLSGVFDYDRSLFLKSTIERLWGQYESLLALVLADPDKSIETLPMLMDRERHRMLVDVRGTFGEFPFTPQGKLDRSQCLGAGETVSAETEFAPPTTPLERTLADLWSQLLNVDRVGRNENFFELGGHSLLATQMVLRLERLSGVPLSVRQVFNFPTVAELAMELVREPDEPSSPAILPPFSKVSRAHPLPLSYAQQRLWFLQQLDPNSAAYNVAAAYRIVGPLQVQTLRSAIDALCQRHEALRTRFVLDDGQPKQQVKIGEPLSLEVVATTCESDRRSWVHAEAFRAFDLKNCPVARFKLFRTSASDAVLLISAHHIVVDGWSMGVLLRELSTLYTEADDTATSLSQPSIQYADYVGWQRATSDDEQSLRYWTDQLSDLPTLELPRDRRPSRLEFRADHVSVVLDAQLSKSLQSLSLQHNATTFMTMLAALKLLLHRNTPQDDVVVGTPVANRNHADLEQVVGFFVNSLAIRTNLGGNPTFTELLQRVKEVALDAFAHQSVPFERIVERLRPDRDLDKNPLFQVMFEFDSDEPVGTAIAGINVGSLPHWEWE